MTDTTTPTNDIPAPEQTEAPASAPADPLAGGTLAGDAPSSKDDTGAGSGDADDKSGGEKADDAGDENPAEGLTVPEGYAGLDADMLSAAAPILKALPAEARQQAVDTFAKDVLPGLIEKVAKHHADQQVQTILDLRKEWGESTMTDAEIGAPTKEAWDQKVGQYVAKARDGLFAPEFREFLDTTGLGNHPEMIRGLYRAGKALSEGTFVVGERSKPPTTREERFYGSSA